MFKLTRSLALVAVFAFANATIFAASASITPNGVNGPNGMAAHVVITFSNGITTDLGVIDSAKPFTIPSNALIIKITAQQYGWNSTNTNSLFGDVVICNVPLKNGTHAKWQINWKFTPPRTRDINAIVPC